MGTPKGYHHFWAPIPCSEMSFKHSCRLKGCFCSPPQAFPGQCGTVAGACANGCMMCIEKTEPAETARQDGLLRCVCNIMPQDFLVNINLTRPTQGLETFGVPSFGTYPPMHVAPGRAFALGRYTASKSAISGGG